MANRPIEASAIELPNGNRARLVRVPEDTDADHVIDGLELRPAPRALLILNGATAELEEHISERLEELFTALAQMIVEEKVEVLTGGTDAGIFALFGQALERCDGPSAPCIGVVAAKQIETTRLEPHHTHFVLVDGRETGTMYRLAAARASRCPSVALFAGGGRVTLSEMLENVRQNREMIFIAGSQGSTDAVIAADDGVPISDQRIRQITREGRVTVFSAEQPPAELAILIGNRLLGV